MSNLIGRVEQGKYAGLPILKQKTTKTLISKIPMLPHQRNQDSASVGIDTYLIEETPEDKRDSEVDLDSPNIFRPMHKMEEDGRGNGVVEASSSHRRVGRGMGTALESGAVTLAGSNSKV